MSEMLKVGLKIAGCFLVFFIVCHDACTAHIDYYIAEDAKGKKVEFKDSCRGCLEPRISQGDTVHLVDSFLGGGFVITDKNETGESWERTKSYVVTKVKGPLLWRSITQ